MTTYPAERKKAERESADAGWRRIGEIVTELLQSEAGAELRDWLPPGLEEQLAAQMQAEPWSTPSICRRLMYELREAFVDDARRQLVSFGRVVRPPAHSPLLHRLQQELEQKEQELLESAVALELNDLASPATLRAAQIQDVLGAAPPTVESDPLLEEATRAYLFGLFAACALLCRSAVERALRNRIFAPQRAAPRGSSVGLGGLLRLVERHRPQGYIVPAFLFLAHQVEATAVRAVHQGLLPEYEARECLQNTRRALPQVLRADVRRTDL